LINDYIYSSDWRPNRIEAREAVTLLSLTEYVALAAKRIKQGSIQIKHDNYRVI